MKHRYSAAVYLQKDCRSHYLSLTSKLHFSQKARVDVPCSTLRFNVLQ
uniref:Uncharacterized protein n=1 Tax=Anguilla anguilla TaxID=7936 RepID=A0A0E9PPL5_ANGAN